MRFPACDFKKFLLLFRAPLCLANAFSGEVYNGIDTVELVSIDRASLYIPKNVLGPWRAANDANDIVAAIVDRFDQG